ncbi:RIP metalloprotease RseP [Phaeodactylibacter sp.]|uniref:RIP metalloprotease RseP n=1 Tax=Phaeodactylibacter sp. TaxID=1940289 RepID=UPI0025E7F32D|nr:RIP metalloprotease RseP [Phaeodactylibacter sp.]MCI4647088.1 RIP metalloprotease RseP [Phaeodactylibacter sp.]MCI5091659.1 RIP metalloprotease RseP [Phaeodactylibacter sp.]
MDYLIMGGQLMLSLSILIVLHELGHFLPARLFGTRVEKFYLFFDPWFELYKKKIGETEYGIGWLPLGGYVKISGMIDESFDTEQMSQEPQPWEFRSKPAWQRLIIMLGGVTVNFILGFLLYGFVLWVYGQEYLPNENLEYGIQVDSLGQEMGLRDGDHILSIAGKPYEQFNDRLVVREIIINNADQITVEREGREVEVPIDPKYVTLLSSYEYKNKALFYPRMPFKIKDIMEDGPAEKAGIKPEDQIIGLDGQPTPWFIDFARGIRGKDGVEVDLTVLRNGSDTLQMALKTTKNGMIGVERITAGELFGTKRKEYSFAQAMPAGVQKGWTFLGDQVKAFGQMFRGRIKASESLGGFGTIGSMFGNEWLWERFWTMTAVLSLILAFMNLLPIPALDGGHVMFLLYEMVTGRKPSDKFLERATIVGFIIVIGLVLYANGLDIIRSFFS